jgi:oxygen-independent coproporphyrinogen-3 oxidase
LTAEPRDPGFAVYVHWPFCQSKCPYCDFNSHVRAGGVDEARFLGAYLKELDHMAALTGPRDVRSVFFGGGTPSLMAPETVAAILERIGARWWLSPGTEITLEANPSSVEAERFTGYRAAGVNRVSLGIQSLEDEALKALGRLHSAQEALNALEIANSTFERVSFDMIYARPGQTIAQWKAELARALEFAPAHLSLYQLTIEPDTMFAVLHMAGKLQVPGDEEARVLYEATQALCEQAGLPAYEISNHARAGEACRHNLVYWRMGDYAGIGPGAHGRVTVDGVRHATSTERSPEAWCECVEREGHGIAEKNPVSMEDTAQEILLMGLRLAEGMEIARYEAAGGVLPQERLDWLKGDGLIEEVEGCLRATRDGRLLLNAIVAELAG